MSHPNPTGNGCSLEDCLTNLFALTDLCGIKWKRLASENLWVEALDDPVLVGFSRCVSNDILCVWRRVQKDHEQRQPDFTCSKELWVFWYGDEPLCLRQAIPPDLGLKEIESGTWDRDNDKDNGLTYECRTLLFKALHNLIERNLLLKNFVRLGRWFVLPYEHGSGEAGVHLSFCFHYFLHGESQVCASIEVKLRPPVWKLTSQHLAMVQDNQASIQVILAPHGLNGILTGVTYADNDPNSPSAKMFGEWAGYYPIKDNREDGGNNKLPNMVEVIVGGTRMRYPSCYVLVCDNDDMTTASVVLQPLQGAMLPPHHHHAARAMSHHGGGTAGPARFQPHPHMSPPSSPLDPVFGLDHLGMKVVPPLVGPTSVPGIGDNLPSIANSTAEVLGCQLAQKVRQDACISSNLNKRLSEANSGNGEESQQQWQVGLWNFTDPASKVMCNCVRHRKKALAKAAVSGGKHGKGEKLERPLSRISRNSVPFHRRGPQVDDILQFDVEPMMSSASAAQSSVHHHQQQQQQPNPAFLLTGGTTTMASSGGNASNGNTTTSTQPQRRSSTPMMHESSVLTLDTPNSAPSPLDEPQPLASSSLDPTMPTLSPHPPPNNKFLSDAGCNNNGRGGSGIAAGGSTSNAPLSATSGGAMVNGTSAQGISDPSTLSTTPSNSGPAAAASAGAGGGGGLTGNNGGNSSNGGPASSVAATANICNGAATPPATGTPSANQVVNGATANPTTPNSSTVNNNATTNGNNVITSSNGNIVGNINNIGPVNNFADVFVKALEDSTAISTASAVNTVNAVAPSSMAGQAFSWSLVTTKTESICHWVHSHQQTNLKRPSLPMKGSESESEQSMESLYDYNTLNEWITLPLKRGRFENISDSLSGEVLISQSSSLASHSRIQPLLRSPSPPEPDPYEFSDEASKDPKTLTTRSRPSRDDTGSMPRPSPLSKDDDSRPSSRQGMPDAPIKDEPAGDQDLNQLAWPLTPGGSLTTEGDLKVMGTDRDLQHLFQSDSSEEDDDGGNMDPNLGVKTTDDLKIARIPNGSVGNVDLGRMYPTPPSHETNKSHSPETMTMTDGTVEGILAGGGGGSLVSAFHHSNVEVSSASGPPPVDPITNVKCDVFLPSSLVESVGSSKYSLVDLPSGQLSPVATVPEYKPTWSFALPLLDAQHTQRTHYVNLPSIENIPSTRTVGSGIDASPAIYGGSAQQRTPLSYELTSPASNSSSYLNKTNNSIDNQGTNSQLPEANSLLLNVLLSDSILNLFKDHNFDSCNICVCNADINGSDVSVYLPDTSTGSSSGIKCTCAFSATVNRRFGYDAGLFYEDEVEITGLRDNRYDHRKPLLTQLDIVKGETDILDKADVTPQVLSQLLGQYGSPFLSCIGSHHLNILTMSAATTYQHTCLDHLQMRDANDAVCQALEVARQAMDHCNSSRCDDSAMRSACLHKWPYLKGPSCLPSNSQDIMQCLTFLHPILQNAIENKRVMRMWENTYRLQGPISWKDFHELAGRGTEENHEPQPIPQILVGHDRDLLSLSPYSLRYWDKQFLEPYGRMRDVLYVVVAPDNDFILQHVISFFKELSTVYEMCRLGKHCFINKPLRDGVLRVGKQKFTSKSVDESVDDWFNLAGDSQMASKLKHYAQVCKNILTPILRQPNLDKSMFDQGSSSSSKAQFKMPEPANTNMRPQTPDSGSANPGSQGHGDENKDPGDGSQQGKDPQADGEASTDDGINTPGIVIYLLDPFSYGQDSGSISRLAMIGLLRCYQQILLPEHLANNLSLQLIPLSTILQHGDSNNKLQTLKSIAFSVFTSSKWNLNHNIMGRSLTGFGPAAAADSMLRRKTESLKLYSPPYVLAPTKSRFNQLTEGKCDQQTIVFCGYCLSEDQRWLIAVCTDERGELMEHTAINIEIPNRNRRKKASARRGGLGKLWDFILGVVALSSGPTRLVIGRFGRMGHGELKGWAGLLSKKNLQSATRKLKEMCSQCSVLTPSEVPGVLSACLVSFEMHPSFMVLVDAVKQDEKQSSQIPLQTPRDASVTHILVFPTSATAQVNANPLQQDPQNDFAAHLELEDVFSDINQEDMSIFDLFTENLDPPANSPGSPGNTNRQNSRISGPSASMAEDLADPQDDENVNLLQQPLAMGYFISTAPPGPLPKWFWSACPENELTNPHVFKSALHIHESSRQDDLLHRTDNRSKPHALDSHMTCDVLRYVLENYNALSWLTFDPVMNDRRSCLPVHFVVLMQLYHALNAFV